MRVFVTGATGFVGTAIVQELLKAGHDVLGLARSEAAAASLAAAGAGVQRGDLEDLDSLRSGAAASDGVIHAGFIHEFWRFKEVCEIDRVAIQTMGSVLAGSDRPLIITSGTGFITPGRVATEEDAPFATSALMPRIASEEAAASVAELGVHVSVVRLPVVHGDGDHGFIPLVIGITREKVVSAYIGDGLNRWPSVHLLDAAPLYRLALEKGEVGARYHCVGEEGITFRDIAEVIGKKLDVPVASISPEEAADHFGMFAMFAYGDGPASSKLTQERLGWSPVQTTVLNDLEYGTYF